jgi:signal transduction histidine kinase
MCAKCWLQNLVTVVLGGGISLDSKPGAGTTVRLVFPRVAPQEQGQERGVS